MEGAADIQRYIAFLRGINISGKNKVPMPELQEGFEALGFGAVKTYLNSGNVLFSSAQKPEDFKQEIEAMIAARFHLDIPVFVLSLAGLEDILQQAPSWWGRGEPEIYDNLIFIIPPATFPEVLDAIGEPKEGLERIENYGQAIFWSFSRRDYQKTNWWPKTAGVAIRDKLTIRTANTVRKIAGM